MREDYRHPMNYYLLVGGSRDGEIWDGEPEPHLRLPTRPLQAAVAGYEDFTASGPNIELELYTVRVFGASGGLIKVYGHASLSDMDVQLALIRGYSPKGKRR